MPPHTHNRYALRVCFAQHWLLIAVVMWRVVLADSLDLYVPLEVLADLLGLLLHLLPSPAPWGVRTTPTLRLQRR